MLHIFGAVVAKANTFSIVISSSRLLYRNVLLKYIIHSKSVSSMYYAIFRTENVN